MDNTLNYYNQNASRFVQGTLSVDFKKTQERFLAKLQAGAYILDFGCGSGRDTRYFLEKGYRVDATDGSEEICKIAGEYTGINVKQMLFEELCDVEKYDGIWACSSILHLSKAALAQVLKKMAAAVKDKGVIYTSFKYGEFEGERDGRYFSDFTIETFTEYIAKVPELLAEEYWITGDVRPGRGEEKWLNLILRKSDIQEDIEMNHAEKAVCYYNNNFNCSQSVFTAFATELGIEEKLALKLATDFGGGARKGELCGAVSGALMVLGLLCGHCESDDSEGKMKAYRISEEYMNRFIQKNGSAVCRDLLGYDLTKAEDMQEIKERNLFKTLCPEMVRSAAEILEEMIEEGIK